MYYSIRIPLGSKRRIKGALIKFHQEGPNAIFGLIVMCLIKNKSAFSIHNENSFPLTYFGKDILILKILVIWFRLRIRYLSYLIMSLESCHRNKRVSCQFCNQSIPRRTKSFKTVIRLTLACALLLYCVNGSLIDISYFHSIPIFIGKLLFWIYLFHQKYIIARHLLKKYRIIW